MLTWLGGLSRTSVSPALVAACVAAMQPSFVGPAPAQDEVAEACADADDEDVPPKRFVMLGACATISGSLSIAHQQLLDRWGGSFPTLTTRRGAVFVPDASEQDQATRLQTGDIAFRLETTRDIASNDFATAFEVKLDRSSGEPGRLKLVEGLVSFGGASVGYTDSLMNFWSGDFQFSATAPSRTVGRAAYAHEFREGLTLAVAAETGVPSTQDTPDRFMTVYPDDPVASARLRYESDTLTVHLSAMRHELKAGSENPLLLRLGRAAGTRSVGWAASAGLTLALPAPGEDSEFSLQATYAHNASPYLGTNADLSALASIAPPSAETRGWSIVASLHHAWSAHWETNVMASRLTLDITLPLLAPSVTSTRYAGNLAFKPMPGLKIGGELGFVDLKLENNGRLGLLSGASGQALVGYLFAEFAF